jgi:hypothetical protein
MQHGRFRTSIFLIAFSFNGYEKTTLSNISWGIKFKLNTEELKKEE